MNEGLRRLNKCTVRIILHVHVQYVERTLMQAEIRMAEIDLSMSIAENCLYWYMCILIIPVQLTC